uniref:Zinc finger CCCH domain-containing protein 3 n=1 Tax=Pogona vitticeps TaxID=103695 RepID=A0ABM5GD28_9SAUR
MEEKEQLRRQIRLLQGLINDHKNVHGNAPLPPLAPTPRWRNSRPAFSSRGGFSTRCPQQMQRDFPPHPNKASAWRNKYSLVNVPSRPTLPAGHSISASATATTTTLSQEAAELQPVASERNVGLSPRNSVALVQPGSSAGRTTVSSFQQGLAVSLEGPATSRGCASGVAWPLKVGSKEKKELEASSVPHVLPCKTVDRSQVDGRPATCRKGSGTAKTVQEASQRAPSVCRTISESAVTLKSELQQPLTLPGHESCDLSARKKPALQVPALHSLQRPPAGRDKPNPLRTADPSALCTNSAWEAPSALGASLARNKQSQPPLPKDPVLSTSVRSPRFRKASYTWVANPSKSCRPAKRWAASKSPENARHSAVGSENLAKPQPRDLGAKQKKPSVLSSKLGISSSQYKWKASGLQPSPSMSTFTWRRKDCNQAGVFSQVGASTSLQAVRCLPLGHGNPRSSFGSTGFLNYKLRSRTKIIKRKGSACSPADKRNTSLPSLLLKSRYSLRKKTSPRGRSSPTARRAAPKGLVQIGKHCLRRLPASRFQASAKAGSSFLLSGPNKVVNTRYRIVKKTALPPSGSSASFSSPAHSWRTRRLSASRSLGQHSSRHPTMGSKSQALQHRWRNRSLRCIGGVMYRVSANKLAKTSSSPLKSGEATCRSHARAARLDSALGFSGYSPPVCPSRAATSRYIASRAVQRSLAIIRQARQKKEKKKEYCMYYNRFGKCNRGENCPYIHDPEKVAVCTRFLRGTCKKTDGTCPFSHKVSKDKMPVCSYFLKGICNHADCPYSHVYVSRKAEVCSDFLKGYCPLGEKCKKKHTLVCPDFSKRGTCPKGSQCKLQHPQRKRPARPLGSQHDPSLSGRESPATKMLRKDDEDVVGPSRAEQGEDVRDPLAASQTSKLAKLPSFISLQTPPTSPSEEDRKPEMDRHGEEAGKPLQIKPRL